MNQSRGVGSAAMQCCIYLNKKGIENIKNYEYHGCGLTLVDKILDYWWRFAVTFLIPRSIAPNVLTLIGFLCMAFAFLLVLFTSPRLENLANDYVFLIAAIFLFAYQTLDAIDGKQARRTHSSSALGQIFDHGCDTFTAVMFPLIGAGAAGLGVGWSTLLLVLTIQAQLFFFSWWELHFHCFPHASGQLGVTEGQIAVIVICLVRGIYGGNLFSHKLLLFGYTLTISKIVSIAIITIISGVVFADLPVGLNSVKNKKLGIVQLGVCYHFLIVEAIYYNTAVFQIAPALNLIFFICGSSIIAIRMQLSAVSKQNFDLNIWPLYPLWLVPLTTLFNVKSRLLNFASFLVPGSVLVIYLSLLIFCTLRQISSALDRPIFAMPKQSKLN